MLLQHFTLGLLLGQPLSDANISQDLIGAVPTSDLDSHFAQTFLISRYGRPQLIRWQQGDAQPHLSNDSVKHLLFPFLRDHAQAYIGNKLRQAERIRLLARRVEERFREVIADRYPTTFGPILETGKTSRALASELNGDLNPGQFNPERVRLRRYLTQRGGKFLGTVASITTPLAATYQPSDGYLGLDGITSGSCMLTPGSIAENEVEGAVRVLPQGPAISKLRPYLNKVCYIPGELAGCFGSTELLCVRPQPGVSGWFLYGVLKLESTIRQLNPVSTGSTHPRVSREDVLDLVIPWHEDQESLGGRLAHAQRLYVTAHRLVAAGRILVEALIEGRVDEALLVAAEEDPNVDRSLLQRLTPAGLDVNGSPPLFPDIDLLFNDIAQSADGFTTAV